MSVLTYGVLIEVEPGLLRPAIACTAADLTAAHALEVRKVALYAQVELLVADATRWNITLSDELRERAVESRGDLRALEQVRVDLESVLLQPV